MFLDNIERLIRRDPARRGLIATEELQGPLCLNHLAEAANDLVKNGSHVIIVTGFFIPGATPPAAETDGPPGAALLAAALIHAGMSIQIVTDNPCRQAVAVAVDEMGLDHSVVTALPNNPRQVDEWVQLQSQTNNETRWTHLIAIERVGPSHTSESIRAQLAGTTDDHVSALEEFEQLVPASEQGRCYNMRGHCLDDHTAPLHRLFDFANRSRTIKTIGIGDGGNEIGMGTIPWHDLRSRLNNPNAAKIPCRISTHWTIVAGVSNWGGMALGAATLWLQEQAHLMTPWTSQQQLRLLERLVAEGPAVDGITGLREPTVDGLPFLTYIQPWEGIRRLAELKSGG